MPGCGHFFRIIDEPALFQFVADGLCLGRSLPLSISNASTRCLSERSLIADSRRSVVRFGNLRALFDSERLQVRVCRPRNENRLRQDRFQPKAVHSNFVI